MCRILAALLVLSVRLAVYGQDSNPQPPNTPSSPADIGSRPVQPPLPPMPPDAPMPDLGTLPMPQDKKQSAVKRKLEELVPRCLDVAWAFHTCWSWPPATEPKATAPVSVDPQFAKDMEVGNFYLNERRNYKGAELRFRDALVYKPNDPEATFRLAQSLEGLKQVAEAKENYEAYLKFDPSGRFSSQAKKCIDRLQNKSASEPSTQKQPSKR